MLFCYFCFEAKKQQKWDTLVGSICYRTTFSGTTQGTPVPAVGGPQTTCHRPSNSNSYLQPKRAGWKWQQQYWVAPPVFCWWQRGPGQRKGILPGGGHVECLNLKIGQVTSARKKLNVKESLPKVTVCRLNPLERRWANRKR